MGVSGFGAAALDLNEPGNVKCRWETFLLALADVCFPVLPRLMRKTDESPSVAERRILIRVKVHAGVSGTDTAMGIR